MHIWIVGNVGCSGTSLLRPYCDQNKFTWAYRGHQIYSRFLVGLVKVVSAWCEFAPTARQVVDILGPNRRAVLDDVTCSQTLGLERTTVIIPSVNLVVRVL